MNQNTPYVFLYVLILLFLPIASFRSLSGGMGLGGFGVMAEVYFASFIILTIVLIICLIISRRNNESKIPKYIFISGVILAFIVNEIICIPHRPKNENEGYFYPRKKEQFFSKIENDTYNMLFTMQNKWEESWLKLSQENWSKKDTINY